MFLEDWVFENHTANITLVFTSTVLFLAKKIFHSKQNIELLKWPEVLTYYVGVVRTLFHTAETVVTTPKDKDSELKHVKTPLKRCGYQQRSF